MRQTAVTWRDALSKAIASKLITLDHAIAREGAVTAKPLEVFFELRETPGLKKKPSTSELLDWLKLLLAEDIPVEALQTSDQRKSIPPLLERS